MYLSPLPQPGPSSNMKTDLLHHSHDFSGSLIPSHNESEYSNRLSPLLEAPLTDRKQAGMNCFFVCFVLLCLSQLHLVCILFFCRLQELPYLNPFFIYTIYSSSIYLEVMGLGSLLSYLPFHFIFNFELSKSLNFTFIRKANSFYSKTHDR